MSPSSIHTVYIPHRARIKPTQENTLNTLIQLLKQVPKYDYIIVLGDLNEQLCANIKNRTDHWTGGAASKNADKILDIMRMYDLYAINTHFEPKKGESVHTYLSPKPKQPCV